MSNGLKEVTQLGDDNVLWWDGLSMFWRTFANQPNATQYYHPRIQTILKSRSLGVVMPC